MSNRAQMISVRTWAADAKLYYPCAGADWISVVELFGPSVKDFKFCDLFYSLREPPKAVLPAGWRVVDGSWHVEGPVDAELSRVIVDEREVRYVVPARATFRLQRALDGREIAVTLRRGFGQYGLHELAGRSLDVFVHRGDSPGEGGSNVWFLANRKASHAPLANLLDVLRAKLRFPAIVASDGSNTDVRQLRLASVDQGGTPAAFVSSGLLWLPVDVVGFRGRRCVFWEIRPA